MRLPSDQRGRLTIVDVVLILASVAVVGALWPVVEAGLTANAGELSTGEGYLFQMVLAVMVLVILASIWRRVVRGAGA
jgi:hypothetical protein